MTAGQRLREWLAAAREDAREWTSGRSWLWRAPLLLYLAYAGVRHLGSAEYQGWFGGITFGIHELGHVILGWAGKFLAMAGGSIAQVAAPIAAAWVLLRQRDWFGVAVAGCWLAFSLWGLALYVGDARARQLPLLGLTDDPEHDWHYLLKTLGLLSFDTTLAFLTRVLALATWSASVAFGAWLLWQMAKPRPAP